MNLMLTEKSGFYQSYLSMEVVCGKISHHESLMWMDLN